jgi:hypothetical protein
LTADLGAARYDARLILPIDDCKRALPRRSCVRFSSRPHLIPRPSTRFFEKRLIDGRHAWLLK